MDSDTRPSLLPREAYRFWPTDVVAMRGSGRFAQRLIFKRQELSDAEEDAISRLITRLDTDSDLSRRLAGRVRRADLLRFIYAAEWDVERAQELVRKHISWLDSTLATVRKVGIAGAYSVIVEVIQTSGGFYTHGRDCFYRPLIVLVPSRLYSVSTSQFPLDLVLDALIFALDFIEQNMLLPGQVENWVLLVDLEETLGLNWPSIQVSDRQEMREIFDAFQTAFPCRLAAGYIWKVNRSLWARVTVILSPETSGKFSLLADSSELLNTVNPSQLEARFGGSVPNKTVFWPPDCPERGDFTAQSTAVLGEYSSYQEYFPERSLTLDDSASERSDSAGIVGSIWPLETMNETEEGAIMKTPVRVMEPTGEFSDPGQLPKKREIQTTLEANEGVGIGCSCVFKPQQNNDCALL